MTKPDQKFLDERLQAAIEAVINQQIATNNPKETVQTLERLQEEGFSKEEAYNLIGQLVALEVAELFAGDGQINVVRYVEALGKLPAPFVEPKSSSEEE